jgi:hypothetical protein
MADGIVQVAPDSTGKKVDTSELSVGGQTVERQRIVLADPTTAANLAVVNSDGSIDVNINQAATATLSNIASTATSTTLLASNASRKGVTIFNDGTTNLFIKFGTTSSSTSFTYKLQAGATFEMPLPIYTGNIDGIADSANGNWRITELT